MTNGNTKTAALRLLRRLSDEVFRRLRVDEAARHNDLDVTDTACSVAA